MNIPETPRFLLLHKKSSYISHQSLWLICRPTACTTHKVVVLFLFLSVFFLSGNEHVRAHQSTLLLGTWKCSEPFEPFESCDFCACWSYNVWWTSLTTLSAASRFLRWMRAFCFSAMFLRKNIFCHCFIFWLFESTYEKNLSGPAFC